MNWRRGLVAMGVVLGGLSIAVPSASATQSASITLTSKQVNTCSVTSIVPTMTSTRIVTGKVTVKCTLAGTYSVSVAVVELDGTAIDPTTELAEKVYSVSVKANTDTSFSTSSFTCVNTEDGNEELATRAKVSPGSSTWSSYDMALPSNNSFAC